MTKDQTMQLDHRAPIAAAAFAVAALLATATPVAQAQEFPAKPIRLLIPFPPGGGTDIVSRIVGNKLTENTKWAVVLENRPGAGGNIAIETAAKAPADGYTIVMGQTDNVMLGPWTYTRIGYDTVRDLAPIVQVSKTALAIVSNGQGKLKTPADMVERGKSPAGLSWGNAGNGSVGHLFGEQYKRIVDIQILQVPYKGATPAFADLLGGQVDIAIMSVPSVTPLVRSGKLTGLAVTSGQRSPALPQVPTLAESGASGVDVTIWLGLFAPIGTPAAVIERINAEMNKVLRSPDVVEKFAAQGIEAAGGTVQQFTAIVKADYERWGKAAKESGVKIEQ